MALVVAVVLGLLSSSSCSAAAVTMAITAVVAVAIITVAVANRNIHTSQKNEGLKPSFFYFHNTLTSSIICVKIK